MEANLGGRPLELERMNPSMKNPIVQLPESPEMYATDTADLFTEILCSINKRIWLVEAHSQAPK